MPGMPIYQDSPSNLKNQVYATDGSNVINIKSDASGRLKIVTDAADPLAVSVDEASDSIAVYGNDGSENKIIKTNTSGQLDIRPLTSSDEVSVVVTQASDSIAVYGNDGSENKIIKTNTSGQLDIRPLTSSDEVSVVVTQASDSILVYGNDGSTNRAIRTDSSGNIQVNTHVFTSVNLLTNQATGDSYAYSSGQDISNYNSYAFYVANVGDLNAASVKIQLSPDNTNWADDGADATIAKGTATIVAPNRFLRYIRIAYKSTIPLSSTNITSIFQAQS